MALKDWALPTVAKLELVHPVNGPTGIFLHMQGEDSKAFRDATMNIMRNRASSKQEFVAPEQLVEENTMLAAVNIVGWSDDAAFDGPYSPERALELMKKPELSWMREQVEAFRTNRANFFRSVC